MTHPRIDSATRTNRNHEADDAVPTTKPASPAATARAEANEARLASQIEKVRTSPDLASFYRNLAPLAAKEPMATAMAETARAALAQQRIDAVRESWSGPYTVEGQTISAPPMFRLNGGHNEANAKAHAKEFDKIATRAGIAYPAGVRSGATTPSVLVRATQALIDAGKLPPGPPETLTTRIRDMQWEWGIGVDCAAYTRSGLEAATGKSGQRLGLAGLGSEGFRQLDRNAHFAKVTPTDVRPGDVLTLDDPYGPVGHNVIARGHTIASPSDKARLTAEHPACAAFLRTPGPHHVIEVDSSWGAGENGASYGGVRRDTWLYDESTKTWGSFDARATPPAFRSSPLGPCNEKFHGAYRAR